jgi:rhodanese-related sulfurtransferase
MKKISIFVLSFCLVLAMTCVALATPTPTPETLDRGKIISAKEAKALFDKKAAVFFDVRNLINYGRGHIPGAVALPYKGKVVKSVDFDPPASIIDISRLPPDRDKKIVFYSHGASGWKSYFAARIAIKAGYKNIMWFRGGFSEWSETGYPCERGH